jgi:hypothetical protein
LSVHAASLTTGEPLPGVALSVLDAKGESLVTGTTDSSGNVQLAYALNAEHVLVAHAGKDVSLLPFNQPALDLSDFARPARSLRTISGTRRSIRAQRDDGDAASLPVM